MFASTFTILIFLDCGLVCCFSLLCMLQEMSCNFSTSVYLCLYECKLQYWVFNAQSIFGKYIFTITAKVPVNPTDILLQFLQYLQAQCFKMGQETLYFQNFAYSTVHDHLLIVLEHLNLKQNMSHKNQSVFQSQNRLILIKFEMNNLHRSC